jgi:predicted nucleic acid-binding protein
MTRVIDASALLDLAQHPDLAARLLAHDEHHAPRLICWEVGNAIHVKMRKKLPSLQARQQLVTDLLNPLDLSDQIGKASAIGALTEQHGLSFYDAAYLQLAIDLDCPLLTHDGALHAAAGKALGANRALKLADVERAAPGAR